jgi:hypothetical protein
MQDTVKILYASRYRFPDKTTGQIIEKATVQYLSNVQVSDLTGDTKGVPAVTVPCPYALIDKLKTLPASYHVTFGITMDTKGRPQQRIEDAELVNK